mmetsp:Transcript_771/g.1103  ORF Transcript_771/g.1103 Transcript_771/m.1103 type:complete len:210 (+) Transcript_771:420-1049(+)
MLHKPILSLLLLVQDRHPAIFCAAHRLFFDDLAFHHRLEGPLRALLLLGGQCLHQPLLTRCVIRLLLLEVVPALLFQLLVRLNAVVDPHVPRVLALPQEILESRLFLRHEVRPALILGPHLILACLKIAVLLLSLCSLLPFNLSLAFGISNLPLIGFLRLLGIQLRLVLKLELLLVELLLCKLLFELLPCFHLHLLALLFGSTLVVQLL